MAELPVVYVGDTDKPLTPELVPVKDYDDEDDDEPASEELIDLLGFDPDDLEADDAEFKESEHPRDENGKFSSREGGQFSSPTPFERDVLYLPKWANRENLRIVQGIPACRTAGQCTQQSLIGYKRGETVHVGLAVRKDRYEEAKGYYEKDPNHWAYTEAIPHAWNVRDGEIVDRALGSKEAARYIYFGAQVPDEVMQQINDPDDLALWGKLFSSPARDQAQDAEFKESEHPRGASAPGHSGGEFAKSGGGAGQGIEHGVRPIDQADRDAVSQYASTLKYRYANQLLRGIDYPPLTEEERADKEDVEYTPHAAVHDEQCRYCRHFEAPSRCRCVAGDISPSGWCELFDPVSGGADDAKGSKYSSSSKWQEELHPRDKEGKFAKKGTANPAMVKLLKQYGFEQHPEAETEVYYHPKGHHIGFHPTSKGPETKWFTHYKDLKPQEEVGTPWGGEKNLLMQLAEHGLIYPEAQPLADFLIEQGGVGKHNSFTNSIEFTMPDGSIVYLSKTSAWTIHPPGKPALYGQGLGQLAGKFASLESEPTPSKTHQPKTHPEEIVPSVAFFGEPVKSTKPNPVGPPLVLSEMKQVGEQKGSQPGGVYEDPWTGYKYYIKHSKTPDHARNELLAAKLYALGGVNTLKYQQVDEGDNKLGVATRWQELKKDNMSQLDAAQRKMAQRDFAVHAWLANWDAAGIDGSNQGIDESGNPISLDLGGSLLYRAQGQPKGVAFNSSVDEWESLRSASVNKKAASLFGDMTADQLRESAAQLAHISAQDINDEVLNSGLFAGDITKQLALSAKLNERRTAILKKAALAGQPQQVEPAEPAGPTESLGPNINHYLWAPKYVKLVQSAPSATKQEGDAVRRYTGGAYLDWNKRLRQSFGRSGGDNPTYALRSYLRKASLPEPMTVTRKVSDNFADFLIEEAMDGTLNFVDHGFVSSDHWTGKLSLRISLPQGAQAAAIGGWSVNPDENEILIQAGSKYRIDKFDPNSLTIDVTLVRSGPPEKK